MSTTQRDVFSDVEGMLRAVMADFDQELEIRQTSTFRDDLEMESIDVVALAGRLQSRYGSSVNFAQFLAGFGATAVVDLRVGQLVDFIVESLNGSGPMAQPGSGAVAGTNTR